MLSMTIQDMLRFESIFDLLIRLGFTEDQQDERMITPGGEQSVAFDQIGGRTVAEFVRWGLKTGLFNSSQEEMPARQSGSARFLGKPELNFSRLLMLREPLGLSVSEWR